MYGHADMNSWMLPEPVSHSEAMHTASDLNFLQSINTPATLLNGFLDEFEATNYAAKYI